MGYTKTIYRQFLNAHDNSGAHKRVRVVDKKAAGTAGGASAETTWNVRTLTDIEFDTGIGATLDTNKITLPAGKYSFTAMSAAHGAVGVHRARLVNMTASPEEVLGVGMTQSGLAADVQFATVSGMFELAEETEVQLRHYTGNAVATNGLGLPADVDDDDEYYTIIDIAMETDPAADASV